MKRSAIFLLSGLLFFTSCQKGPSNLQVPSIIGDNMVLQQKTDARIWGKAAPGQKITVTPEWGAAVNAKAGEDGKWLVEVKTPEAGGPYTMKIECSDTAFVVNNILIGEVWLCSGQSNMEMPMAGWPPVDTIMHSARSIAEASLPGIRLFNVQRKVSGVPLEECTGSWQVCSPETLKPFSATAFFFGRKLNKELGIPVGLIESAWGGTPSEAWTSAEVLRNAGEFVNELSGMEAAEAATAEYQSWLSGHKQAVIKPAGDDQWKDLDFGDAALAATDFDDSKWPVMALPVKFENAIGEVDGAVWFRKTIDLAPEMAGKELILSLGPIDDMDRTYFNGELVGATEKGGFWQINRDYSIPGNLVKEGKNTIAVRVLDTQGGGGIWGDKGSMKLAVKQGKMKPVNIEGDWKFQVVAELIGDRFFIFDFMNSDFSVKPRPKTFGPYSPSTLYNAMLNPLINYRIKGAIWYQGEANVGRADQYAKIFPLMIRNWRDAWGIRDFPFYFVQIAPWIYEGLDSENSVLLREAQASSLSVPKTGMVVTLDIATVMNIHPPFKLEVGERLANLALANDYGRSVPCNGPVYKSMVVDGKTIKVSFDNAGDGLVSTGELIPEFEIAGKDGKFVRAVARISGNEVVVSSPLVSEPLSVRYCWRNGATGTLFNKAGLPASQFRTNQ
jgi:sialate O-acetylesterase